MNKITAQVGQIIEVNGKSYRATEGGFEPVVSKGPLGGEIIEAGLLPLGAVFYLKCEIDDHRRIEEDEFKTKVLIGDSKYKQYYHQIPQAVEVETNIPARPTFTPMTAGEAAKLPDIVGRWIAVKVDDSSPETPGVPLSASGCWFGFKDQILLIEGVDLP